VKSEKRKVKSAKRPENRAKRVKSEKSAKGSPILGGRFRIVELEGDE
jgi:hypothetical protein